MSETERPRDYHNEHVARIVALEAEIVSLRKQLALALTEIENFRRLTPGLVTGEAPVLSSFREIKDSMLWNQDIIKDTVSSADVVTVSLEGSDITDG